MECRQRGQPVLTARRQLQPDHPMVVVVSDSPQQTCRLGTIDEAHGAVMAQQQQLGDVADLGPPRIIVPSYREQQLVLGGGQPSRSGLRLAPMLKAPQTSAKRQQSPIGIVGQCPLRRWPWPHGSRSCWWRGARRRWRVRQKNVGLVPYHTVTSTLGYACAPAGDRCLTPPSNSTPLSSSANHRPTSLICDHHIALR